MKTSVLTVFCDDDLLFERLQGKFKPLGYEFTRLTTYEGLLKFQAKSLPKFLILAAKDQKSETLKLLELGAAKVSSNILIIFGPGITEYDVPSLELKSAKLTFAHWMFDDEFITSFVLENDPILIPPEQLAPQHTFPVRLTDVKPETKFPFDVFLYLPANQKLLLYVRKGSSLTEEQAERLSQFNVNDIYIRRSELVSFQKFTSQNISKAIKNKALSSSEKREAVKNEVRGLLANFFSTKEFDANKNKEVLTTCKNVVKDIILETSPRPEIYERILKIVSRNQTNYNHAMNVSVFSSLFALALGLEDIDSYSIGGLLHDIGWVDIPPEILRKSYTEMSAEEKKVYEKHVVQGLEMVKNKKLAAPAAVFSILEQHHEDYGGGGYPKGLKGDQIHPAAQLVRIADDLDDLSSAGLNKRPLTPAEALMQMTEDNQKKQIYNSELLAKIFDIFLDPTQSQVSDEQIIKQAQAPLESLRGASQPTQLDLDTKRRKRFKKPLS
ncbi:MAG: HD domain-containing protein [Oligoflexia bacterium]|nr:HD domain-containing protein [Oligoflexia bacterium]